MYVLDSDAIQTSAAVVAAGDETVLVLRDGLLSAADLACLRRVLGPVVARLTPIDGDTVLYGTG